MSLGNDLSELVQAQLITTETAERIEAYYALKNKKEPQNRLFVIFGILGSILVGLGIILILAHNWDKLSTGLKSFFAFLPLVLGQALCLYTLLKKKEETAWKESSTTFLFLAVGASISLVSQIYNISGNLGSFLLTWMLLCVPLMFLMRSAISSLIYIIGITWYAVETGYSFSGTTDPFNLYWLLLVPELVFYYLIASRKPGSNFTVFHHWLIPVSLLIALGTFAERNEELMIVSYMSLFGIFYQAGVSRYFDGQKKRNNSYLLLGSLGTIVLLLCLSFDFLWKELVRSSHISFASKEFAVAMVTTIAASVMMIINMKRGKQINPAGFVPILVLLLFMLSLNDPSIPVILINVFVFVLGIFTIKDGIRRDHLGIVNYGLVIIAALVVCRFFDEQISFVIRGTMFVLTGAGFFVTNYRLLKKRKSDEK